MKNLFIILVLTLALSCEGEDFVIHDHEKDAVLPYTIGVTWIPSNNFNCEPDYSLLSSYNTSVTIDSSRIKFNPLGPGEYGGIFEGVCGIYSDQFWFKGIAN